MCRELTFYLWPTESSLISSCPGSKSSSNSCEVFICPLLTVMQIVPMHKKIFITMNWFLSLFPAEIQIQFGSCSLYAPSRPEKSHCSFGHLILITVQVPLNSSSSPTREPLPGPDFILLTEGHLWDKCHPFHYARHYCLFFCHTAYAHTPAHIQRLFMSQFLICSIVICTVGVIVVPW